MDNTTTEIELRMGRYSGSVTADDDYYIHVVDSRSSKKVAELRMSGAQFAAALVGQGAKATGVLLNEEDYRFVGKYAWNVALVFDRRFDGRISETAEERLRLLLDNRSMRDELKCSVIGVRSGHGGIQVQLRGWAETPESTVYEALRAQEELFAWVERAGFKVFGSGSRWPRVETDLTD